MTARNEETATSLGGSQREYEFYAFISYKRGGDDEKWAKKLQRRLESYRIPVADLFEKLPDAGRAIPKRIKVFRDKTDLGSHYNLRQGLSSSLESSRYLIAICSPRSAASPYVDEEVRYFVEAGRGENIVPFVIGGASDSSYPPSLPPDTEAVTLSGKDEEAFIGLLARMLRLGYAELYQTHLRATRRRAVRMLSAVAAVLALTAGLALWAVSAERRATKERVESEALVDFLTFDLIREASDYIPTQARASITDKVREHYERWEPREPRAFYARAANLTQQGAVIADHDPKAALELVLQSLALLEQLNRDAPGNEDYLGSHADVLMLTGTLHERIGEPEETAKRYSESLNAARAFSEAFPGSLRGREQLAAILQRLAWFAVSRNMFGEASDYYSECAGVWEEILRLWPKQTRAWSYRMELASFFSGYGFFELKQNNYLEALDYKQSAVEIYENFYEKDPNNRMIRLLFAYELNVVTFILVQLRQEETAGLLFSRGEALWRGLAAEDPLPVYFQGLADMLTHGALIRIEQGHSGQGRDAGALLNEAEELVDSALKSQPDNDAFLSLKSLIGEYRGRMPGGRQNK